MADQVYRINKKIGITAAKPIRITAVDKLNRSKLWHHGRAAILKVQVGMAAQAGKDATSTIYLDLAKSAIIRQMLPSRLYEYYDFYQTEQDLRTLKEHIK